MQAEVTSPRALDLVLQLRRIPLFRALTLESLHTLALAAQLRSLEPGEPLARAGEPWSKLYLVLEGELQGPTAGGSAQELTQRAELLGALALLGGHALPCALTARGPVQLLSIPADALFDLLEADSGALMEVVRAIVLLRLQAPVDTGGEPPRVAPPSAARPLDLVERMLLIWRTFGLENVSVTGLTDMARTASQSVEDGTRPLWRVGDVATELVVVVDGGVTLKVAGEVTREAGPEALLGGLDVMAGTPRRFDALPSAGTVLLHLPASQVLGLFEDHFDVAAGVLTSLSRSALAQLCGGGGRPLP